MNQNTIVQFVGFITNLDMEKFLLRWGYYVQQLKHNHAQPVLQKQNGTKSRLKYISQHPATQGDFKFAFMNKRDSAHFPEHDVRVVHAGGYMPVQIEASQQDRDRNANVMVLIKNQEANINFYRKLLHYRKLNIYQAYYENCAYSFIMEFFVKEADAADFMLQLNTGNGKPQISDDAAIYEDCQLVHAS